MLTRKAPNKFTLDTTDLLIAGMRDSSCRQRIVTALEALDGVIEVQVNYCRARATVAYRSPCQAADLIRSIEQAGYAACLAT